MKELVDQLDKDRFQRMTTNKGIKWKFNPLVVPTSAESGKQ